MAHGLTQHDTMFSVRQAPWHGLGVVLDRPPAGIAEALAAAGLDWTVRKEPVFQRRSAAPGGYAAIPDAFATVRGDTGAVLGVVGERYRVAQNLEALRFLDSLIGSSLHFETAGSLHGGRRIWALARLPEHIEVGGDPTRVHVLVTNSHDGSSAVQAAVTPVRVVCQNTLAWGLRRARRTYSIRHTEALQSRLIEARRVLELTVDYAKQFKQLGDALALAPFSDRQLRRVLDELWPSGPGDVTPRVARSREQTKASVVELFLHGETVGNAPRSRWAAANAIVEHLDWGRRVKGAGRPRAEALFTRAVADGGLKSRALELVVTA